MNLSFLDDILDPQGESFDTIVSWVNQRIAIMRATDFSPAVMATCEPVELRDEFDHICGAEGNAVWRKFFLAILTADWACYVTAVDRIDFARLKFIMTSAYRYARLWCCRLPDGKILPVGYSSWYPISEFVYKGAVNSPASINDRGVFPPLRFVRSEDIKYLYALNVSIIEQLRNSVCSRRLIKAYQRDGAPFEKVGVMAITVDAAGEKFSRIGGLKHLAPVKVQGESEGLFIREPNAA